MKLRDLPQEEKPRERLFKLGSAALSMRELLEIILSQGTSRESVTEIAEQLIAKYKNWNGLAGASFQELRNLKGVGFAKASQLQAAFEFGKRFYAEDVRPQSNSILNSKQAYHLCQEYFKHKKKEHLMLFCLDVRGRLITSPEILSIGTLDCSLIHPREIFGTALKNHAARILLAHNHPSGSAEPSDADLEVTKQVYSAGEIMGIQLIDHIVVGSGGFTSIQEFEPAVFI